MLFVQWLHDRVRKIGDTELRDDAACVFGEEPAPPPTDPSTNELTDVLEPVAVLGSALVAGISYTFSTFVMRALGRLSAGEGIRAMQAINVTVINPWFFAAFFGTAAAEFWAHYLTRWNLWNHVRTAASLASAAAFMGALG